MEPATRRNTWPYVIAVLGAFLIVAALVATMRRYAAQPQLDAERAAERAKALSELRAAEHQALTTTAWIDQSKGLVRLRVEDAMAMVERDWGQNPTAARSNLMDRVAKATALPPKEPEQPSEFE
jgi:uncharacterized protein YdaU (DUF1376 family)